LILPAQFLYFYGMATQGTIRQYYVILSAARANQYPTKRDLVGQLRDAGFASSPRTIERYMEQLRNEFKIDIEYDPTRKGYGIPTADRKQSQRTLSFFERLLLGDMLTNEATRQTDMLRYVSFDTDGSYTGLSVLKKLLLALRDQRLITFAHRTYQHSEGREYENFRPYFLKEYQNRWYLFGQAADDDFCRILGTDRMDEQSLTILDDTFDLPADAPTPAIFAHTIGVAEFYKTPEPVQLAFHVAQLPYLNSLPWHTSQEIIDETDTEFIVNLMLVPNYEFQQRVLAQGANVRVPQPDWLRDKIGSELKKAAQHYK